MDFVDSRCQYVDNFQVKSRNMVKRPHDASPSSFKSFGDLLKYLRERARLSQRELARQVGYHYSYMSRMENNVRLPDEVTLRTRFAPALGIEDEPAWMERLLELAAGEEVSAVAQAGEVKPASGLEGGGALPIILTSLLGREVESQALFQILTSDEIRLVTLIGPPGVGKTRLSLHLAEQLASYFSDGVAFVDLMPILEAENVMTALAAVLGTLETHDVDVFDGVKAALREREMFIVMDNFEQVLDAAPQVAALLGVAPRVKILATSREALRLRGEQEFPLSPLPVPTEFSASVLEFPSVQLFLQRARAVKPGFELSEDELRQVAEICRRLDGLPLAIELAAARVRTFSPADMLEQFDRRFQWLANTSRDIPEWRRTLWSAIAWSYNLLTEKERRLFERLSVFAGGWTVEAAEAVCSDEMDCPRSEIFAMLLQLVDKSLVVGEPGPRYRFLDTIGKFAHEKLGEHGQAGMLELGNRHLRYFADWAETLDTQFLKLSPLVFQQRTGVEINNVRAALDWGLSHQDALADGLRLSVPASLIWLEHGQVRDEYERAHLFLRKAIDPALHARLLLRTAAIGMRLDQQLLSYEYCRHAEKLALDMNDQGLLAESLKMIGDIDRDTGKFDLAEGPLTESVRIYRALNRLFELNQALTSLGNNYFFQHRLDDASAALAEALDIADRIGDNSGQAYALRTQAGHLHELGRNSESLETYQKALHLARASGDRPNIAHCLNCMSIESNLLEDYSASERYARDSIAVFQSLGNVEQAFTRRMLAYALLHQGFPDRARSFAMQSLKDNLNGGTGVMSCLTALAEIKLAKGEIKPAAQLYGFIAPRVVERFSKIIPDAQAFRRIGRVLHDKDTGDWQAEGASMTLEEAVAVASAWDVQDNLETTKHRLIPYHYQNPK